LIRPRHPTMGKMRHGGGNLAQDKLKLGTAGLLLRSGLLDQFCGCRQPSYAAERDRLCIGFHDRCDLLAILEHLAPNLTSKAHTQMSIATRCPSRAAIPTPSPTCFESTGRRNNESAASAMDPSTVIRPQSRDSTTANSLAWGRQKV
jgi:hypothetical protein